MMNTNLLHGILVACLASGLSLPLAAVFKGLGSIMAAQMVIAILSLAYIGYLLARSASRSGRVTLGLGSATVLLAACIAGVSPVGIGLLGVGLIWLVRSLLNYSSLIASVLDALICAISVACAAGTATWTGSPWLVIWTFFLPQALVAWIPHRLANSTPDDPQPPRDVFAQAHRAAKDALHDLAQPVG